MSSPFLKNGNMLKYCILSLIGCFSTLAFAQDARVENLLAEFNTDSLKGQVQKLSGEIPVIVGGQSHIISSRLYNQPGNVLAFKYAKEQFIQSGLEIDSLIFSANGKNLFGIKKGTVFPERVCIIGAHYDNLPTGTFAPGADDNASGCAVVLESARIMSEMEFPNTIIFALWDEEELGLIGSTAYTAQQQIHGDSLLGYINLDMLGWDGNNDNLTEVHVRPISNSIKLMQMVVDCNELYNIGLNLEIVNPGSVNSDHFPFWQKGYSAVGINEEYIGDFNPNWHQTTDVFSAFNHTYYLANSRLAIASFATLALNKSGNLSDEEIISNSILFPNPASDVVYVQFEQAILNKLTVSITDNQGRKVLISDYEKVDQIIVPTTEFRSGFYRIQIRTGDIQKNFSFIKN
jgi:hypothetical protein